MPLKTPKQLLRDDTAKQYKKIRAILQPVKVIKITEKQQVKLEGRA